MDEEEEMEEVEEEEEGWGGDGEEHEKEGEEEEPAAITRLGPNRNGRIIRLGNSLGSQSGWGGLLDGRVMAGGMVKLRRRYRRR